MRTIERIVLPFEARSLTLVDTNPNDLSRDFLERQAILRGSQKLGKGMQALGTSMTAYGSTTTPRGRNSVVMRRGSDGKKQWKGTHTHEGVKYDRPAPRGNKWSGYETKPNSKAGTKAPSSRSTQRSGAMVNTGTVIYVAGRWIPVLGTTYFAYSIFQPDKSPEDAFVDDVKHQDQRWKDSTKLGFQYGKSVYSSPLGKIAISVGLSKLGIF